MPMKASKKAAPFGVIGFGGVELNRDMRLDVDGLKNSRRRRSDGRRAIVDGGVARYGTYVRRGKSKRGFSSRFMVPGRWAEEDERAVEGESADRQRAAVAREGRIKLRKLIPCRE